jgi:hypothetical protein
MAEEAGGPVAGSTVFVGVSVPQGRSGSSAQTMPRVTTTPKNPKTRNHSSVRGFEPSADRLSNRFRRRVTLCAT